MNEVYLVGNLGSDPETQMSKGNEVFVKGKLSSREYTDKDGTQKYITEITALTIKVIVRREKDRIPLPDQPVELTGTPF